MNKKQQTIETYNISATALAQKFDSLGARKADIDETFALIDKGNPAVLEIGCGNGRDASYISHFTSNYKGIDVSEKLIKIAEEKVPDAHFEVADIENYAFPSHLDVIFAFASLIHVPKESFKKILSDAYDAMNSGGVMRISLKHSELYEEVTRDDEFGTRTYYHYSCEDIKDIVGKFVILKCKEPVIKNQKWLEILVQKV